MRNKRKPLGAKPRGACAVCHHVFGDATEAQFQQRYTYHLESLRHKRYLELQTAPPQSRTIVLKSKESNYGKV